MQRYDIHQYKKPPLAANRNWIMRSLADAIFKVYGLTMIEYDFAGDLADLQREQKLKEFKQKFRVLGRP